MLQGFHILSSGVLAKGKTLTAGGGKPLLIGDRNRRAAFRDDTMLFKILNQPGDRIPVKADLSRQERHRKGKRFQPCPIPMRF